MDERRSRWTVRISAAAQADVGRIMHWTLANFGKAQAERHARTIALALAELRCGPGIQGVKARPEIGEGVHFLHVARRRRKGRHFIMFRIASEEVGPALDVLRILHDGMDLPRHFLPDVSDDPSGGSSR